MKEADHHLFALFSSLVEQMIGLRYDDSAKAILLEKLRVAASEEGFDSLLDYYYYLRYDASGPIAAERLIEQLVVSETYFFRELPPLEWLVEDVLIPEVRAGRRPRVWSAACSTGEEPLTLAMLLDERDALPSVDLVASDISVRNLERARSGRYRQRSVRDGAPERLVRRYLTRERDAMVVEPRLLAHVDWRQINLLERAALDSLGRFDAILCRNVLIYFSDEGIKRVVRSLLERLTDDGILLVGVSESLFVIDAEIGCEERRGVFFYRKGTR
jgi:chemotaxis protein methyltransferase CheR